MIHLIEQDTLPRRGILVNLSLAGKHYAAMYLAVVPIASNGFVITTRCYYVLFYRSTVIIGGVFSMSYLNISKHLFARHRVGVAFFPTM